MHTMHDYVVVFCYALAGTGVGAYLGRAVGRAVILRRLSRTMHDLRRHLNPTHEQH